MDRAAQREHCKRFLAELRRLKAMNLSAAACRRMAADSARKFHPLVEDEQREVDAWIDSKYPLKSAMMPAGEPYVFDPDFLIDVE